MKAPSKTQPPGFTDVALVLVVAALLLLPLPVLLEPDERVIGKIVMLAGLLVPPVLFLAWVQRKFGPRQRTQLPGLTRIDRG